MNIIDAIKSGKRFRIKNSSDDWMHIDRNFYVCVGERDNPRIHHLYIAGVILAKYEVEEKSVTITESQFDFMICKYRQVEAPTNAYLSFDGAMAHVKKELGF